MKKLLSLILVLIMCLPLCACIKSKAAQECEELIAAIGEVSVESKDAIAAAENAYSALTSDEKDSISASAEILNDALDAYYFECCKAIFSELNKAHKTVDQFGADLYAMGSATKDGFNFGDENVYFLKCLLSEVSISLTEDEMKQGIEAAVKGHNLLGGSDADICIYVAKTHNFLGDLCILGVSNAYKLTGSVSAARDALYKASVMMAEFEGEDSYAQRYLILKKYYTAIEEYLEICLDCESAAQIAQLGNARDSYQGYVQAYTGDLDALLAN